MGSWLGKLQSESSDFAEFEKRTTATSDSFETPPATNRARVLNSDPRSPTTSINRTPIEVEGTPRRLMSFDSDASPVVESPSVPLIRKPKDSLHKRVLEKRIPLAARNNSDSQPPASN